MWWTNSWIIEGFFTRPVFSKICYSKTAHSYSPIDPALLMLHWWHILPGSSPFAARADLGSARTAAWSWSGTAARAARRHKRLASPPSSPCDLMGNHCLESCPACSLRVGACNDMKWYEWVGNDTCGWGDSSGMRE